MTKTILVSALAFVLLFSAAAAQTFTISGETKDVNRQIVPINGKPAGVVIAQAELKAVNADGSKETVKTTCGSWFTQDPRIPFEGVCSSSTSNVDTFVGHAWCVPIADKPGQSNCWGDMTGTGGKYDKRQGTLSWKSTFLPERKGSIISGTGQWNE